MKRNLVWSLTALIGGVVVYASTLLATPANPPLFSSPQMLKATLDEIDLNTDNHSNGLWRARLETRRKGLRTCMSSRTCQSLGEPPAGTPTRVPASSWSPRDSSLPYDGDDPDLHAARFLGGRELHRPGRRAHPRHPERGHHRREHHSSPVRSNTGRTTHRRPPARAVPRRALTRDRRGSYRQCPASRSRTLFPPNVATGGAWKARPPRTNNRTNTK